MADIAELGAYDIAGAVALWATAGLTRPWNNPVADAERALRLPGSTIFGARVAEALVGTVMTGHDGHRGWVYYLAVAEDFRRQGIARKLMTAAEGWCAGHGMVRLNLMVRGDNLAAMEFYVRAGYRQSDVVVLQIDLSPK